MRDLMAAEVNRYRVTDQQVLGLYGTFGDGGNGVFLVPSLVDREQLVVLASNGLGWDHVSVSRRRRVPNWYEMQRVKRLFFEDDEVAMQLHVAASDHISHHPHCLHLWRPQLVDIPLPPKEAVA